MKILYITTSLLRNESASIRNISLINGLIENNIKVDVITLEYLNNYEDMYLKNVLNKKVNIQKIKIPFFNKNISRIKKLRDSTKNSIKKKIIIFLKEYLKKIIIFPDVYFEAIKNSRQIKLENRSYDYIISSSDAKTSHFIAQEIIKNNKKKVPWIQIWGDPWKEDIGLKNINYFQKYRINKNENKLLEKADKVFYISELTANNMKNQRKEIKNKIYVLNRSYLQEIVSENKIKKEYIFVYTGSIKNRNILPLIESIKRYNENSEIKIRIKFYGIEEEINLKDKFIEIYPRISFKKVLDVYKEADVLVYIDNLYNGTQIPGKIYDYFGTDKVILGLYENDVNKKFLERFNRIELYKNQEDKINLNNVIDKIGTQKVLKEFSPKILAEQFLKKLGEKS
ncbi:hypothetical protein H9X75_06350 [Fusobacterium mortiferum]|uniref:hypothetical protein n=1 Tax=Fusobacterium mortiferum TaxID=850 RepID=UPI0019569639|nr:hypothetical protein [Fusobacterium mortiferum]